MPPTSRSPRACFRRLGVLLGCAGATLAPAWAQTPPDAGRLLEQSRPATPPPLPPAVAPRVLDVPVRPTITLPDGATVQAGEFRISGARSYPVETLVELLKPWLGKRLDLNGLNEAAGALTRYYQAQGHLLSYAYIPAQRVADAVIEIAVLEGRLDAVQVVTGQDVRLNDAVVQAYTDRLATNASDPDPVLQRQVERQLLLLNDIGGVTARAAFTPGTSTGGADMVVSVAEDEPLSVRAELNNHGSRSTGEARAGLSLQLRDLSGWGEQTDARALVSRKGSLVSGSLGVSVPTGGDGFRIGANLSRLSYELAGAFRRLGATGTANTFGVEASFPFVRSTDRNLSAKLGVETKRLNDEVQVSGSSNTRRNNTVELALSLDRRDDWGGVSALRGVGTVGVLDIFDSGQRASDAQGLNTGRRWAKAGGQFVRQQSLGGPFSLYLRAAGQASGGNLDSSEKFGLAGPGGVRAYAPGEASVDQGALLSLEGRFSHEYLGGSFIWGAFVDHAEGLINRYPIVPAGANAQAIAAGNAPRLTGTGLSVQWSGADLGLSASVAWRAGRVPTAEGGDPKPRVYLQLVLTP